MASPIHIDFSPQAQLLLSLRFLPHASLISVSCLLVFVASLTGTTQDFWRVRWQQTPFPEKPWPLPCQEQWVLPGQPIIGCCHGYPVTLQTYFCPSTTVLKTSCHAINSVYSSIHSIMKRIPQIEQWTIYHAQSCLHPFLFPPHLLSYSPPSLSNYDMLSVGRNEVAFSKAGILQNVSYLASFTQYNTFGTLFICCTYMILHGFYFGEYLMPWVQLLVSCLDGCLNSSRYFVYCFYCCKTRLIWPCIPGLF